MHGLCSTHCDYCAVSRRRSKPGMVGALQSSQPCQSSLSLVILLWDSWFQKERNKVEVSYKLKSETEGFCEQDGKA